MFTQEIFSTVSLTNTSLYNTQNRIIHRTKTYTHIQHKTYIQTLVYLINVKINFTEMIRQCNTHHLVYPWNAFY